MQVKTIYVNELNLDFASHDSIKSRQIMMIDISVLRTFKH